MAFTVSNLTNGFSNPTTAQTAFTTASIAPAANALVLLTVWSYVSTAPPSSIVGAGLTWVQIATKVQGNWCGTIFRAISSASFYLADSFSVAETGSGALTINFSAGQFGCVWAVDQITGCDLSGTNGSGAIVQSGSASHGSGITGEAVTLAAFASPANLAYSSINLGEPFTAQGKIVVGPGFSTALNVIDFMPFQQFNVAVATEYSIGTGFYLADGFSVPEVNSLAVAFGFPATTTDTDIMLALEIKAAFSGAALTSIGRILSGARIGNQKFRAAMASASRSRSSVISPLSIFSRFVTFASASSATTRAVGAAAGRLKMPGEASIAAALAIGRLAGVVSWTRNYLVDGFSMWGSGPGSPAMFGFVRAIGALDTNLHIFAKAFGRTRASIAIPALAGSLLAGSVSKPSASIGLGGKTRLLLRTNSLGSAHLSTTGGAIVLAALSRIISRTLAPIRGNLFSLAASMILSRGRSSSGGSYRAAAPSESMAVGVAAPKFRLSAGASSRGRLSAAGSRLLGSLSLSSSSSSASHDSIAYPIGRIIISSASRAIGSGRSIIATALNSLLMEARAASMVAAAAAAKFRISAIAGAISLSRGRAPAIGRINIFAMSRSMGLSPSSISATLHVIFTAAYGAARSAVRAATSVALAVVLRSPSRGAGVSSASCKVAVGFSSHTAARDTLVISTRALTLKIRSMTVARSASRFSGILPTLRASSYGNASGNFFLRAAGHFLARSSSFVALSGISSHFAPLLSASKSASRAGAKIGGISSIGATAAAKAIGAIARQAAPQAAMLSRSIATAASQSNMLPRLASPMIVRGIAMSHTTYVSNIYLPLFQPIFRLSASAASRSATRAVGISAKFAILNSLASGIGIGNLAGSIGSSSLMAASAAAGQINSAFTGVFNLFAARSPAISQSSTSKPSAPLATTIFIIRAQLIPVITVGAIVVQNDDDEN